jgi:hypothetical protein
MNTENLACNGAKREHESLTEMLENNEKQIHAITERANAIKLRIEGYTPSSTGCAQPCDPCPANLAVPGLYKQAYDNTNLLAELYEIILTIDSRL